MRLIGYGGMLTESFVAVMALITASILNQHLYFTLNAPAAQTGGTRGHRRAICQRARPVRRAGDRRPDQPGRQSVGEKSIVSRTGGAPTLAFGMSEVLAAGVRRPRSQGVLVPLRDHVRGAVHPDHRRCRHPRRALHALRRAGQLGRPAGKAAKPELAPRRMDLQPGRGRGVGQHPADGRDRSAGRHQHAVSAVRYRQPAARGHRADRHHRGRHQEGPAEVGVDPRSSAAVGSDGHADGVVAEDLLRGSRSRLLDPARPVRGGGKRGQDGVRFGQEHAPDPRRHQEHLHPGHPVDPLRVGCRHRVRRRNRRCSERFAAAAGR